jgi:AraC family transcriptional regulator, transcriptional activator of pobA
MAEIETLEDFYQQKLNWLPDNIQQGLGHFNVFRHEDFCNTGRAPVQYNRKDFYKTSLYRGEGILHYAEKSILLSGPTLLFLNPRVPYTFENLKESQTGFFCIFTEIFFMERIKGSLTGLHMYAPGGKVAYKLDQAQDAEASTLFVKMLQEINSDYVHKYDLLRNYVTELIHFALKTQPSETLYQHPDANSRITAVFTELLERQFPIESPSQRFSLRAAKDFAQSLSVHVNHLNRAIRETTGRTTTDHIAGRLVNEAKSLLRHTNWNVSEIGYCLGFDEPSHFNNFFKKHTSLTPNAFRVV